MSISHFFFQLVANFGGVMGCAIGMSVAAACELIYWLTLKPLVKWMSSRGGNEITSSKCKCAYKILFIMIFLALVGFSVYQFNNVNLTYIQVSNLNTM